MRSTTDITRYRARRCVFITLTIGNSSVISLNTSNVIIAGGDPGSIRVRVNGLAPGYDPVTKQVQVLAH